ncbi:MAG: AsnC family transcriptional regulator [Micavibrio sp.]|nr:AsnC family transcriptional regulator [Micavibrio sp.]|tara:strand:- start:210 stop:686 length:477 start_codon:yes stop_codon:yes gene_type:complete
MRRVKLDKIDRKILNDLQSNGRITNVELSKNAGISAPPCLRRVNALEDAGYIKGYYGRLDAQLMGYGITVYAQIKLESQSEADLKKFEQQCDEWRLVRECHMLSGEVDYLLRIVAKDWEGYQSFLTEHLTAAENVSSVKTMLLVRSSKERPGVPVEIE